MLENSFKALPLIAASLLSSAALFGSAFTQVDQSTQQLDELKDLESKVSQLEERKANGNLGVNQPYRPKVKKEVGLILEADFLYWKAEQEGFEYAVKSTDPILSGNLSHGKLLTHDFDWMPAFRVGLGYHLPYDRWDLKLLWTRYLNLSHEVKHKKEPQYSPLFFIFQDLAWNATHVQSHYGIKYDTLDLTLQREYFVSRSLTLRPIIGLRSAWITQGFHQVFHSGPGGTGAFGNTVGIQSVKLRNVMNAIGILGGMNLNFCFNRNWSIYGDIAGAIMYADFDVWFRSKISGVNLLGNRIEGEAESDPDIIKTMVQTAMGLQWQSLIARDRFRLLFSLGYEILFWFNQSHVQRYGFPGTFNGGYYEANGSLTLQGGTFRAAFEF